MLEDPTLCRGDAGMHISGRLLIQRAQTESDPGRRYMGSEYGAEGLTPAAEVVLGDPTCQCQNIRRDSQVGIDNCRQGEQATGREIGADRAGDNDAGLPPAAEHSFNPCARLDGALPSGRDAVDEFAAQRQREGNLGQTFFRFLMEASGDV
jgi:hypothetical protein